jgi:very-short-patch-repair endonuclease
VLDDVAEGACSVLEHGYLTRVERAHGLARPRRQVVSRSQAGLVYRDVEYAGGLVVELDGLLFHDTTEQRDRDFDRDLVAAVDGRDTVRLSWGQVFDRPCRTAGLVAALLRARGWSGAARACGPKCGGFRAPAG